MDEIKKISGVGALDTIRQIPGPTGSDAGRVRTNFAAVFAALTLPKSGPTLSPPVQGRLSITQSNVPNITNTVTGLPSATGSLHERALGLRAYRQELLASNIANADTPGYKAVDIDVAETLRNGGGVDSGLRIKYAVPNQDGVDGNTVEMDLERAKFTQNALMYEYELDRVKGFYKSLDDLLRGTPY